MNAELQDDILERENVEIGRQEENSCESRSKRRKKRGKWNKEAIIAIILALIPVIGFLIFNGFPLVISFLALFCDVDLYELGSFSWNNFEGFKVIFSNDYSLSSYGLNVAHYFYKACGITLWIASTQLVTLLIAVGIAVLLATKVKGHNVFQVLFFVPYICSTVAVSLMWRWIFSGEDSGVLNTIFGTSITWLNDPSTMTWTIIIAIIWQAPGYGIVMYKSALANIDVSQYEAAELDGANAWEKFIHITLLGIAPTTFYLLIAGIGAGFLTYDIAALMIPDGFSGSIGGNESMGLTLVRLMYYLIRNDQLASSVVSAASVITWVLFVVTGSITLALFRRRDKLMEG